MAKGSELDVTLKQKVGVIRGRGYGLRNAHGLQQLKKAWKHILSLEPSEEASSGKPLNFAQLNTFLKGLLETKSISPVWVGSHQTGQDSSGCDRNLA